MSRPVDQDTLGGRLPLLAPDHLDHDQLEVYQASSRMVLPEAQAGRFTARLDDGRFIGPFNALLRVPGIAAGMGQWTTQIAQSGMADDVREVVVLTIGATWGAPYEIAAHRHAARTAGVSEAAIQDILARRTPRGLSGAAQVAHRLTVDLLTTHSVTDALYAEAAAIFGEAGLVTLLCLVGQYQTISSILVLFRVPVPERSTTSETEN